MYGQETAMTLALLSMVAQEIVYAISCRNLKQPIIRQGIFKNKIMNLGLILILIIELLVFMTPVGSLISIKSINYKIIIIVFLINSSALLIYEALKPLLKNVLKIKQKKLSKHTQFFLTLIISSSLSWPISKDELSSCLLKLSITCFSS